MPRLHVNSINLQTGFFFFQSTTVQQMSSSVPAVTSVSMATTGVTECLTALTAQTREPAVSPATALSSLDKRTFYIQVFLDQLIFLFKFSPFSHEAPGDVPPWEWVPVPVRWDLYPVHVGVWRPSGLWGQQRRAPRLPASHLPLHLLPLRQWKLRAAQLDLRRRQRLQGHEWRKRLSHATLSLSKLAVAMSRPQCVHQPDQSVWQHSRLSQWRWRVPSLQ